MVRFAHRLAGKASSRRLFCIITDVLVQRRVKRHKPASRLQSWDVLLARVSAGAPSAPWSQATSRLQPTSWRPLRTPGMPQAQGNAGAVQLPAVHLAPAKMASDAQVSLLLQLCQRCSYYARLPVQPSCLAGWTRSWPPLCSHFWLLRQIQMDPWPSAPDARHSLDCACA